MSANIENADTLKSLVEKGEILGFIGIAITGGRVDTFRSGYLPIYEAIGALEALKIEFIFKHHQMNL